MSVCEKCWTLASFQAQLLGGVAADHYRRVLAENESDHLDSEQP